MRATLIDERDVTEEIHDAVFRVWGHLNGDGAVAVYEIEGASLVETIDWARANFREAWSLSADIRGSDRVTAVWLVGSDPSDRADRSV